MSVTFTGMPIYGITAMGKKVKIGKTTETVDTCKMVGGTIFYIDPTGDGVYRFYDAQGNIMTPTVGSKPYAYEVVTVGTKDKFYVYHDEIFTSKRWTYYSGGAYVYNSLGTSRAIGAGKTNTATVMSADGGAYVTANSNGTPTIWYQLSLARTGNIGGCNDWFVPSDGEIEELRKAIGFRVVTTSDDPVVLSAGAVTGGVIAGEADGVAHYKDYSSTRTCYPSATKFLNNYIWSSSEGSAQGAWFWGGGGQAWSYYNKYTDYSVLFARAF